ncbi:MAG: AIPR family protein [Planctomycetia bacterium]|nr:AIPR family protein [Planctomycetia bacterium]
MTKTLPVRFPYHVLKNVASPEDVEAGRHRYAGSAPASSYFELSDDENVRRFLQKTPEGGRRKPTLVNQAILKTLKNNIDEFSVLNGGVVLVARGAEIDDKGKTAALSEPSIINGSQTRGILAEYFASPGVGGKFPSVSFELIVTDDEDLIAEISIARNTQNDVKDVSIYGRRGLFEDLEQSMAAAFPDEKLRMSETDFGDTFLDTEKLVQVVTAMSPEAIAYPSTEKREQVDESRFRIYAYRHRARCLQDFARVMDPIKANEDGKDYSRTRKFILNIAPSAWAIYKTLKNHPELAKRIRSVERETPREIAEDGIPDGIVFPVLSALSQFAKESKGTWRLSIPQDFDLDDLCRQANFAYTSGAGKNNPNTMGKSAPCYHQLHSVVGTFLKYRR